MPNFVIAGKPDCADFIHAVQVSTYLKENLPDFKVQIIQKENEPWRNFLDETNHRYRWFNTTCPVIWKEVAMMGGRPYLIGGLSEFWEYCDDYYGLFAYLSKDAIEKMRIKNLRDFTIAKRRNELAKKERMVISIYGINNNYAHLLLSEVFAIPELLGTKEVLVKIYDIGIYQDDDEVIAQIVSFLEEFDTTLICNVKYTIITSLSLREFIMGTDILLIAQDYSKQEDEDDEGWYYRCLSDMQLLGDEIGDHGLRSMRIVLSHVGPTCYTANCLVNSVTGVINLSNIIAVTVHVGLKYLNVVSKLTGVLIENMSAPPVWGFVGFNHFVDVEATTVLRDVIRPYERALKNIETSSLPLGTINTEVGLIGCIQQKEVEDEINFRNAKFAVLKPNSNSETLALLRATGSLLKLWYSAETTDEIISLGVRSNGSHGIPNGLVFSQPVMLDERKMWVPFRNYPKKPYCEEKIKEVVDQTNKLLEEIQDLL